jgi:hypothetical protein
MAFHGEGTTTEWMRLFSPVVNIPSPSADFYVTLDFDLAYSTETDPSELIQAFDGLTVRINDQTGGTVIRSVLAEAFAEQLNTGSIEGFPKHLPRSNNANYFEDMSVWAGYSAGLVHVSMKFPGAGMAGRSVQLRFEYTQDASGTCTNSGFPSPCGVAIDNVLLRYATLGTQFVANSSTTSLTTDHNPWPTGQTLTLTAAVGPSGTTGTVEFFDGSTSLGTAPVVSGSASLQTSTLTVGTHSLTAAYSGDPCDLASNSAIYSQDITTAVGVADAAPVDFGIRQVAPNPASKTSSVTFGLPRTEHVALGIYDLGGRQVRSLASSSFAPGVHTLAWDLRNAAGERVGPGVYFVRVVVRDGTRTARFAVLQ